MASQEKALISMAQQFTGLPMDMLIGAPLNAAVDANAAMALTQAKFIMDTCFSKTDGKYTPVMIEMTLSRGVLLPPKDKDTPSTIETVETSFYLPLITILPLNSLGVDNVDITFEMEVKSAYGEEQSEHQETEIKASASWEVKAGWGPVSATVKGNASYDHKDASSFNSHYEKSNSAKYSVNVHASQLPIPRGVNTIIDVYSSAIQPQNLPAPAGSN